MRQGGWYLVYRLIVVDDEKEIRNGICNFFPWGDLGFEVVGQFALAPQALEWLRENTVDVVVSDILMEGMSGLDLARELAGTDMEIVLLSGYSEFKYAQSAIELGVSHYLLKSASHEEMMRVFSSLKHKLDQRFKEYGAVQDELWAETDPGYTDKIIAQIEKYMKENLDSVTLEKLSEHVHLSPFYISKFYRQKTGCNFSSHLVELRMKKAAVLLRSVEYKISEISGIVGYSNSFNFTRTFKSYYGMTPSKYRNISIQMDQVL